MLIMVLVFWYDFGYRVYNLCHGEFVHAKCRKATSNETSHKASYVVGTACPFSPSPGGCCDLAPSPPLPHPSSPICPGSKSTSSLIGLIGTGVIFCVNPSEASMTSYKALARSGGGI